MERNNNTQAGGGSKSPVIQKIGISELIIRINEKFRKANKKADEVSDAGDPELAIQMRKLALDTKNSELQFLKENRPDKVSLMPLDPNLRLS